MGFVWSQSALKDFEKTDTCPKRWYDQWVEKLFTQESTEPQNNGNYFEYLCIGKNAKGNTVTEIPKTKSGEVTALEKRMEIQAKRFKDFFDPTHKDYLGYQILDTQLLLSGKINGINVEGTADIHAVTKLTVDRPVIIDIKTSEDIYSTRSEYGWGNPINDLDLIQQSLYSELYYQMSGVRPLMVLMIFELGTKLRVRILNIEISEESYQIMEDRFFQASEVFDMYNKNGWSRLPSEKECETCKVKNCEKRFIKSPISIESHKY